jgi:endonuclease YncB( thermonuclease family)
MGPSNAGQCAWAAGPGTQERDATGMFDCIPVVVVDGDTLRCGDEMVRLLGIDAPELLGHCRPGRTCTPGDGKRSQAVLVGLVTKGGARCERYGNDRYGRPLARCSVGRIDLSCELVRRNAAVFRYSAIDC